MKRKNKILCKSKYWRCDRQQKIWKAIKSYFSDKSKNSERIVLIENDKMVMEDGKVALTLNTLLSNIVSILNIPKFKDCYPLSERIPMPTLRAILKYANHPSISAIKKYNRILHLFSFSVVEKEDIIKELHKLNPKKATHHLNFY